VEPDKTLIRLTLAVDDAYTKLQAAEDDMAGAAERVTIATHAVVAAERALRMYLHGREG